MKTVILDGHNSIWRLQASLPNLTANGKPIQVVYGFLRLLRSCLEDFEPDIALVCWDSGRSKYRKKIYPDYKANRDEKHKDQVVFQQVNEQLETIRSLLRHLNVAQLSYPDTEADDLIGIACYELGGEKVIISADKDMLHLVSDEISVWSPIKTLLYTRKNFRSLMDGLSPKQWLELRAITGDISDNIQGAAEGVGPITAKELILRFGDLATLFNPNTEKKVHKMGNRYAHLYVEGSREIAYRNLMLMDLSLPTVREDYPSISKILKKSLKKRKKVDRMFLRDYFQEQDFQSLLKDLPAWVLPFEDLDVEEA